MRALQLLFGSAGYLSSCTASHRPSTARAPSSNFGCTAKLPQLCTSPEHLHVAGFRFWSLTSSFLRGFTCFRCVAATAPPRQQVPPQCSSGQLAFGDRKQLSSSFYLTNLSVICVAYLSLNSWRTAHLFLLLNNCILSSNTVRQVSPTVSTVTYWHDERTQACKHTQLLLPLRYYSL